jgi:hypothetical protein
MGAFQSGIAPCRSNRRKTKTPFRCEPEGRGSSRCLPVYVVTPVTTASNDIIVVTAGRLFHMVGRYARDIVNAVLDRVGNKSSVFVRKSKNNDNCRLQLRGLADFADCQRALAVLFARCRKPILLVPEFATNSLAAWSIREIRQSAQLSSAVAVIECGRSPVRGRTATECRPLR